jgi:hypothetical protein
MLTKCTVQESKSPVKILSGSVARRDLILALKGYRQLNPWSRVLLENLMGPQLILRILCSPKVYYVFTTVRNLPLS